MVLQGNDWNNVRMCPVQANKFSNAFNYGGGFILVMVQIKMSVCADLLLMHQDFLQHFSSVLPPVERWYLKISIRVNDRPASFRLSQDSPNNPFNPLEKWGSATHFGRIMNPRSASVFAVILTAATPEWPIFCPDTDRPGTIRVYFPLSFHFHLLLYGFFPPLPHKLSSWICYYGNHTRAAVGKSGIVFSFTTVIPQGDAALKL